MAAGTTTQLRAVHGTQDADAFLDVDALAVRYGIGRTKSYELVGSPEFRKMFLKAANHAGWQMVGPFVRSD